MGLKWRNELNLPSKLLLVVVVVKSIIIGVSALMEFHPDRKGCFDAMGNNIRCATHHSVNQAITLFLWTAFFLFSVFSGIFFDNLFELYSAMFQATFITAYAIFQFWLPSPNDIIDYVLIVVSGVCQISYFVFGFFLYQEYVWHLYKKVGSDKQIRTMYRVYLLWKAFFKLDVLYTLFSVILSGKGVFNDGFMAACDWTVTAIIIFIYAPLGYYAVETENRRYAIVWMIMFPISWIYIAAMWSWQYIYNGTNYANFSSKVLGIMFSVTGALAVVVHVILLVYSIKTVNNFGKGLHDILNPEDTKSIKNVQDEEIVYAGISEDDDDDDDRSDIIGQEETGSAGIGDDLSIHDVLRNTYAVTPAH